MTGVQTCALPISDVNAFTLAGEIAGATGIMREFREGKTIEDISRLENLEQLLNAIQEFTEAAETNGEPATLDAYLATVSLLTDQDSDDADQNDRVTLMTVHSAKGLEFRYVYITGMEENLFPSLMSSGTAKELEEERRLFYVALTRAMKRATLSYASNRYKWGNLEHSNPSRFLREIDQEYIQEVVVRQKSVPSYGYGNQRQHTREGRQGYRGQTDTGAPDRIWRDRFSKEPEKQSSPFDTQKPPPGTRPLGKRPADSNSENPEAGSTSERTGSFKSVGYAGTDLSVGDRVKHERFGNGKVIAIEGNPPDTSAVVEFAGIGTKKLLLRFAKLVRI